jgi:surface antigen-like variable number repeat protein
MILSIFGALYSFSSRLMWKIAIFLIFLFFSSYLSAQSDYVIINSVQVEGNKHTKSRIILREMDFTIGDTIPLNILQNRLVINKNYIMNTGLFVFMDMNITKWDYDSNRIDLLLKMKEAWYIFPFPVFELADRNFNVWWKEQNRSLKRTNYGIRFVHLNTTGNRDPLKLQFHFGYTQKLELVYSFPSLNKKQTFGISGEFFYARNKEIAYKTIDDKLVFERREEEFPLQRFRSGFSFFYRPKIRSVFYGKLEYQKNTITDYVITELNPKYFLHGNTSQQLMYLRLEYAYENRDIKSYPMAGNFFSMVMDKEGLGIFNDQNGLYLTSTFGQYFSLGHKWSTEVILKTKVALIRQEQPYNNYWSLGYLNDYLNGYEYYVIDGLDYYYAKTAVRFQLFNNRLNWGEYMPISAFREMPVKVYVTLNNDFGYVNSTQFNEFNSLGNRPLWGGGIGLDFVLFYDKVIRIEYSMNHLLEKGLYLHYNLSF